MLLLDEPFSNLDAGTRERVRADTLAVLRRDGIGAILVTHDAAEAVACADRIVLMHRGRIVQSGSAEALYAAPATPFAARALGEIIEIPAAPSTATSRHPSARCPGPTPCRRARSSLPAPGGDPPRAGGRRVPARILGRAFAGPRLRLDIAVAGLGAPLRLDLPPEEVPGEQVGIELLPGRAHVFPLPDGVQVLSDCN